MFDKEQVRSAVEAVNEAGGDSEALRSWSDSDCKVPYKVIYILFSNCITINNGACPEWHFCDPFIQVNKR